MKQTGIFKGRAQVVYPYGRFGWTRGGGKPMPIVNKYTACYMWKRTG